MMTIFSQMIFKPFCFSVLLMVFMQPALFAQEEWFEYDYPPTKEGLNEMFSFLMDASDKERAKLTKALRPELEDCEAVFEGKYGKRVFRYQQRLMRMTDIIVHPLLEDQTEILIWAATTEDLQNYEAEARNFPGGYREIAAYLKPEQTLYRVKYVQPGRKLGSAYDALVYVNDKWCLIHRPWAILFE